MSSYQIPDSPPEEVQFLYNGMGREFRRVTDDYWASSALGPGRGTYHWVDLLAQQGPLYEERPEDE